MKDPIAIRGHLLVCKGCDCEVELKNLPLDPFQRCWEILRHARDFAVFHHHPELKKNAPAVSTSRGA